MPRIVFLLTLSLLLNDVLHAQTSAEEGLPFFSCTSARDIGGSDQVWTIAQDERGIIYVGSIGVSEYDGASWRYIANEDYSTVRWLDRGDDGVIYAAGVGEFGYLAVDSLGTRRYHSLLEYVPEDHRNFDDIWSVRSTPEGTYFLAWDKLFLAKRADGASEAKWSVRVWTPEERFLYGFYQNGTYYVHQQTKGLMRMTRDGLVAVSGGDQFGGERVQVMLQNPDHPEGFILGTFNRGLFRFDGSGFQPWKTDADAYLRAHTLYKATVLQDGTYALATLSGGIVLLGQDGVSRGILDVESGLPSNTVLSVFTDQSGQLWTALRGAICQIDVPSPLTRLDASRGVDAGITDVRRHDGVLYITTQSSVQYFDHASRTFKRVEGFGYGVRQSWQLLSVDRDLLAATATGLYEIRGDRATAIVRNEGGTGYIPFVLHRSVQDPKRVFVGLTDGFASVYRDETGRWRDEGRIPDVPHDIRFISEPSPGLFWLGSMSDGAARLRIDTDRRVTDMERFGKESGFQTSAALARVVGNRVLAVDLDQVLRFDEENRRFVPDSLLSSLVSGVLFHSSDIAEGKQGVVYAGIGGQTAALYRSEDGTYRMDRTPFRPFANMAISAIYPEENGIVWFAADEMLIRYNPKVAKTYDADFPVLVRRVLTQGDREVYAGAAGGDVRLPYAENSLRFEYSAAAYQMPFANTFQTMLDGFDEDWSTWANETRRAYTNLPPGEYTFRVRGRNLYEQLGTEAAVTLAILPPWYRSIWAYVVYGLLFAGTVFATDRLQRRRLVKKERERAAFEQAELRAAAAEAQSKALEAENQKKKNIELLSRIGRDITSTLSIEQIIGTVYEHVNALMDASVFGIGLHNAAENRLEFPATKERGETLPFYTYDLDNDRIGVRCFKRQEEIVIQNFEQEWSRYLDHFVPAIEGDEPVSLLFIPLVHHEKTIGVITAQSFEANAYTEDHLNILRSLATYTAIALDNADAYRRLNATVQELNDALDDLKTTQEQLVTQEKMASLGALTAGIAHEVKNPLNFVNNFAQLVVELSDELRDELAANKNRQIADVLDDLEEIVLGLKSNARQIAKHGKRADDIVRGMMEHATGGSGERYEVAVNGFVEEYVHLAYHGMRARGGGFEVRVEKDLAPDAGNVSMVPQEIGRVLINLLNNAFDAVKEHAAVQNGEYEPSIAIRTRRVNGRVEIAVEDNGPGIPAHVREKLFEPFFTTKPAGSGTGLGLSLSYDIVVHGHAGQLSAENLDGTGVRFSVSLPA